MDQMPISKIVNISVLPAQAGVGNFNTSNLAIFTDETPEGTFGTDGFKLYIEPSEIATDFGTESVTYKMALAIFSQQPNILAGGGYLVIIPFVGAETLDAAITRTEGLVQYFGVLSTKTCTDLTESILLASAAVLQAVIKVGFFVSYDEDDIKPTGMVDKLATGNFTHSRGLYYGDDTDSGLNALLFAAAYAGRALSVNFTGSNTTMTMNLKDLATIQPDPSMTNTIYGEAEAAGADIYVSFQGVPKVRCFGANNFFDSVYNLLWFMSNLQTSAFNFLATASTKIPQTEEGMDGLKGAYRAVCEQAVTNQYCAPGKWTSPTTFGNQANLLANISQRGYYIYSQPVALQAQTDRRARKAPLIQVALKEAGAIHQSEVIVNINA